jgi:uncharacterized FlaG/YvyC family protein
MQVQLDPNANNAVNLAANKASQAPATPPKSQGPAPATVAEKASAEVTAPAPVSGLLQANVTFRRDSNGQIYYVITDANSGKELREVPPEEIRKAGEGIAEYLKQAQAKSNTHLEEKA